MTLREQLKPSTKQRAKGKRRGRGNSSGRGTFSGKGCKGQNARTGGGVRPGFEGGQTPLYRKMPKLKGFNNINHIVYEIINLDTLNKSFKENDKVNAESMAKNNLIRKNKPVKLLGNGKLEKALEVTVTQASAGAIKAVEKAGGKVILLAEKESNEQT